MIFYKEDSAWGAFNRFMASRHLEDVADFIKNTATHIRVGTAGGR